MGKKFCIIYTSSATRSFTFAEAREISNARKQFCEENEVSGLLVYGSGNFLRFIQGDQGDVMNVYQTEQQEAPQFDVIKLFEGFADTEYFEGYPLGIRILQSKDLKLLDDFYSTELKEYFEECLRSDEMPMKIVKEFIKNNH